MLSLAMFFVMLSASLNAGEHNTRVNPEADAYSKSLVIAADAMPERPAEEAEINDIPFNTARIAEQAGIDLRGLLPEEDDINDIPFNTAEVVRNYLMKR